MNREEGPNASLETRSHKALAANWQFLSPRLPAGSLPGPVLIAWRRDRLCRRGGVAVETHPARLHQPGSCRASVESERSPHPGAARYARYSACVDLWRPRPRRGQPRHAGARARTSTIAVSSSSINGKGNHLPLSDSRVLEKGARGSFQMVFGTPMPSSDCALMPARPSSWTSPGRPGPQAR